jgi:hypothetical protein
MPYRSDDAQMLRLIKAFQKITDGDVRRMIVRFTEEKLAEQQPTSASAGEPPKAT